MSRTGNLEEEPGLPEANPVVLAEEESTENSAGNNITPPTDGLSNPGSKLAVDKEGTSVDEVIPPAEDGVLTTAAEIASLVVTVPVACTAGTSKEPSGAASTTEKPR